MRYPGFVYGSAPSQSPVADGELTVNFYVEKLSGPGAVDRAILLPTPGRRAFLTVPDVGGRGLFAVNDLMFGVVGGGYYQFFADGSFTRIGPVAQDSNQAQLAYNGPTGGQILVSSGGNAYCHTLATGAFVKVLDGEATQIGMIDEYFLAFNRKIPQVRLSALNDGTVWDPLQFAQRSSQPDPWRSMVIEAPNIFFIGEQTTDVWYDAGDSPFPLAPRTGLTIPYGTSAGFSPLSIEGRLFWQTRNKSGAGIIVGMQGFSPTKISTPELETQIAAYARTATIADAEAFGYTDEGHTFYVLRYPSVPATWVYDLSTQLWAQRGDWNAGLGRYDAWRPRVHGYAFGQHLTADPQSGVIATMDVSIGTEADGGLIRRLRRGATLINENRRISLNTFEISFDAGLGAIAGQGRNPMFMFRGSPNGGKTWGNERQMAAGAIGKYEQRAYVTRLGRPRLFVPEITVSDPIPWRILDAFLNNRGAGSQAA